MSEEVKIRKVVPKYRKILLPKEFNPGDLVEIRKIETKED
jgi:hypothetical protein